MANVFPEGCKLSRIISCPHFDCHLPVTLLGSRQTHPSGNIFRIFHDDLNKIQHLSNTRLKIFLKKKWKSFERSIYVMRHKTYPACLRSMITEGIERMFLNPGAVHVRTELRGACARTQWRFHRLRFCGEIRINAADLSATVCKRKFCDGSSVQMWTWPMALQRCSSKPCGWSLAES